MTKLLCFLFLFFPIMAFAGIGFYVTVNNNTHYDATIEPGGEDEWRCHDFCNPQFVRAKTSKRFYTESSSWVPAIQGINIRYGYVIAHVEFWIHDHSYSVTKNIKQVFLTDPKGMPKEKPDTDGIAVGVGTDTIRIETDLSVKDEGYYKTAMIALNLN